MLGLLRCIGWLLGEASVGPFEMEECGLEEVVLESRVRLGVVRRGLGDIACWDGVGPPRLVRRLSVDDVGGIDPAGWPVHGNADQSVFAGLSCFFVILRRYSRWLYVFFFS